MMWCAVGAGGGWYSFCCTSTSSSRAGALCAVCHNIDGYGYGIRRCARSRQSALCHGATALCLYMPFSCWCKFSTISPQRQHNDMIRHAT